MALRGLCLLMLGLALPLAAQTPVTVDYPLAGTVFPPDLAAPEFLFRDAADAARAWRVDVAFSAGFPPLRVAIPAEKMRIGEIDERCIAESNELPKLTPQQEQTRTWTPDEATWEAIRKRAVESDATVTISGFADAEFKQLVSQGRVTVRVSKDPVGAPVFFRDVPLMPAEVQKGVIRPLPKSALNLVAWRLRYVSETKSRTLIDNQPTCMNCHSFSRDGKTLGLDLDGPQNDKGLYALVNIAPEMAIKNEDVIEWSSFKGKLGAKIRVGFMSQVSPDGKYVVTMVSPFDVGVENPAGGPALPKDVAGNFYVNNFKDYRFLQVFYPTRGVLAWYSRETGKLQPLPGADDPRFVHTNVTWSPDGQYLVFARAEARVPYEEGVKLAERANDPNETPIRYDLYRIPFNEGRGGKAVPVAGASDNGLSNSFPKISPDGKWIVYVQAKNGLLMRPDSQLYIVPAAGGTPRRLESNTPLMNSWHSFSPNGRWLVFSSKQRSPYTQMYLTHLDEQGRATPPVLIENATAANRAVNIPEFVNVPLDGWLKIDTPATDLYRVLDSGFELMQQARYRESIVEWKKALTMDPREKTALSNYGAALNYLGDYEEAAELFKKSLETDPDNVRTRTNLGVALLRSGRWEDAAAEFQKAIELDPKDGPARSSYGGLLTERGKYEEAEVHLKKALEIHPENSDALNNLGGIYARSGRFEEAVPLFERAAAVEPGSMVVHYNLGRAYAARGRHEEGIRSLEKAVELSGGQEFTVLDRLSAVYADAGRFADAARRGKQALEVASQLNVTEGVEALKARVKDYEAKAAAKP